MSTLDHLIDFAAHQATIFAKRNAAFEGDVSEFVEADAIANSLPPKKLWLVAAACLRRWAKLEIERVEKL